MTDRRFAGSMGLVIKSTAPSFMASTRSEEHTSELQSRGHLVCRPLISTLFPYTTLFRSGFENAGSADHRRQQIFIVVIDIAEQPHHFAAQILSFKSLGDDRPKIRGFDGLGNKVDRALFHGFDEIGRAHV